jgi:transcriptional regulator with XRE-family HTH domain
MATMKANYLKQYLIDNGESESAFAKRAEVGTMTIWRLCRGNTRPGIDTLDKIAKVMGIKTGTLVNRLGL